LLLYSIFAVHAISWLPCTGNQATHCQVTLLWAALVYQARPIFSLTGSFPYGLTPTSSKREKWVELDRLGQPLAQTRDMFPYQTFPSVKMKRVRT